MLEFKPQIDALRAYAVLGVLYSHAWAASSAAGSVGVRLFFVISGYLITRILLATAEDVATGEVSARRAWRNFMMRRVLRIFPIYYLTLSVAYLVNVDGFRDVAAWHALFGSNFLFAIRDAWVPWPTAHLWSLSVEEQFYLIWPAFIFLLALRPLVAVICVFIVVSLVFRSEVLDLGLTQTGYWVLPPAALDTLGAGALLAVLEKVGRFPAYLRHIAWPATIYLAAICVRDLVPALELAGHRYLGYMQDPLITLSLTALVVAASVGAKGLGGRLLSVPAILWVGKISYGVYLYHLFLLAVYHSVLSPWNDTVFPLEKGAILFLWVTTASLLCAALSWHYFERPINGLKRAFAR